ncbi:leucine-rich repeat protein kinase family protein [Actinidia rufa]|uniref:Leucine-rich repeat protein kinase family protein n=1 Tax=Actinidia rufa TaxID=165716 RepID=A0A7J0DIT9_9ERIC|nr:leucine-rich repeat protein kinase family protein [Actinidia rufa]
MVMIIRPTWFMLPFIAIWSKFTVLSSLAPFPNQILIKDFNGPLFLDHGENPLGQADPIVLDQHSGQQLEKDHAQPIMTALKALIGLESERNPQRDGLSSMSSVIRPYSEMQGSMLLNKMLEGFRFPWAMPSW